MHRESIALPAVSLNVARRLRVKRERAWRETHAPVNLRMQVHGRGAGLMEAGRIGESQLDELRNMRVLLEEARILARNLAYHRRAALERAIGQTLDEIDEQIEDLRRESN